MTDIFNERRDNHSLAHRALELAEHADPNIPIYRPDKYGRDYVLPEQIDPTRDEFTVRHAHRELIEILKVLDARLWIDGLIADASTGSTSSPSPCKKETSNAP